MAIDTNKENEIITLRARGVSFAKIAEEVGVAKQTTVDVCKKNREKVAALKALELEQLYEEQRITSQERITAHASLMRRIRQEIDSRDLADISTDKLIDLYLKQSAALKEELIEPEFRSTEDITRDRQEREYLDRLASTPL